MTNLSMPAVLVDNHNLCGESPLWDVHEQALYWTDTLSSSVFRYDWRAKRSARWLQNVEVNGFALDVSGGLTLVNNSGVWFWPGAGEAVLPVTKPGQEPCRLNDCVADPAGRLLAGSTFYDPAREYALGKLLSITPDGKVGILDEGFHLANGLGFSPDNRTLYLTDSITRAIYAYDYDSRTGHAGHRRKFVTLDSSCGLPDGLTVDATGFVWTAEWYGSAVSRFDPDGCLERRIPIPAKQTSSVAFGGPELTDIFVTSAAKSEPMPVMQPGYDPTTGYFGGALFHFNIGIQGKAEHRTRLILQTLVPSQ